MAQFFALFYLINRMHDVWMFHADTEIFYIFSELKVIEILKDLTWIKSRLNWRAFSIYPQK